MLPKAENPWTLHEAAHLLNRAGFGGSPDEIRAFHSLGREKAVDSLLAPDEAPDAFPPPSWAREEQALADRRALNEQRREMRGAMSGLTPEEAENRRREFFQAMQRTERQHALEAQGWWFRRILNTRAPLREKMTLFWHDHFATSVQKVKEAVLIIRQNELFRRHAFGNFRELTQAIVVDPAMMIYLDTRDSRKGKPNENFAREVMELFTLGEGHYTEQDIREAARAFTGYDIDRLSGKTSHKRRQWDDGSKTVFGKTGAFEGRDIVALIFEQPQAARFMARKIWEFFVHENPSESVIDSLAGTFRQADYQMMPLLREIFLSREFHAATSIRSQIKCPVQYLVQLLKQLEISEPPTGLPITAGQQLGQVLFMPPNVAGWDWGKAWINTSTLLARYNLAGFLTKGADGGGMDVYGGKIKTPGMAPGPKLTGRFWQGPDYEKIAPRPLREEPEKLVDSLIFRFFQGPLPDKTRNSFIEYATAKKGVVFTNSETAELCHLMLSTPHYQLC